MKHINVAVCGIVLLLVVGLTTGCDSSTLEAPIPIGGLVGSPAPDFTLTDMAGNPVSLSQFKGKVVILNFWATWCPPCRDEMPSMEKLYNEYGDKGLVMLAINVEEKGRKTVAKFLKKTPYSFPILLDDKKSVSTKLYEVFRYPESFIIDRNGVVVEKIIGGIHWTSGSAFERVKFLLGG